MQNDITTYSSPGRCGVVGNPSDMYGGSVISCSTKERTVVSVQDHDMLELVVEGKIRTIRKPEDLIQDHGMFDAILASIEYFGLKDAKIKITVTSKIPLNAGLSGSTALITALVAALLEWMERNDYWPGGEINLELD